jgi:hypothetical protein
MSTITKGKAAPKSEKHQAKAFVNWVIRNAEGKIVLKSSRGLALQGHPDFPNKIEDALIAKATACGGSFKTMMEVSINLNQVTDTIDLDSIPMLAAA